MRNLEIKWKSRNHNWGFTLFTELESKHHVSTHVAGVTNHRDWREVCYELVLLLWYIWFTVHQLSRSPESTHNFVSTIFNQCTPKFYIVKHYDHE